MVAKFTKLLHTNTSTLALPKTPNKCGEWENFATISYDRKCPMRNLHKIL